MASHDLPRVRPEEEGIDPAGIAALVEGLCEPRLGTHSLMVMRHGRVLAEASWHPYRADRLHVLHSLSKSFTSTATGFAMSEGHYTLDTPVVKFFPDDLPSTVSRNLGSMRVRDLLSMSCGHDADDIHELAREPDGNWVKAFLARPVPHEPGKHFLYNTSASYMLSAIVQKTTGHTLLEYLEPRLFAPLGIREATWETCPRGINVGGWGLSLTTESIAMFGVLYAQGGTWNGRRVLPEGWVEDATRTHLSNGDDPASDWAQGYGFQFWRCRGDAYRADGAFGQLCVVHPGSQVVVVTTASCDDPQAQLNLIWDRLLPAIGRRSSGVDPGPTIAGLSVAGPEGHATDPTEAAAHGRTYASDRPATIRSARFEFAPHDVSIRLDLPEGPIDLAAGFGSWRSEGDFAAMAAWTGEATLEVKRCDLRSSAWLRLEFRFDAPRVRWIAERRGILEPPSGFDMEGVLIAADPRSSTRQRSKETQ